MKKTTQQLTGNAMVLTERDRELIKLAESYGVLTRDQIWRVLKFGSLTRVNAILLRLTRFGYLRRRFQPTLTGSRRALYLVGHLGWELLSGPSEGKVRSSWEERSDLFLEHQLAINDVRLAFEAESSPEFRLVRFLSESNLRGRNLPIVPDAYLEWTHGKATTAAFLEADLGTESRKVWAEKLRGYFSLTLGDRFSREFGQPSFQVMVVTTSEKRLSNIRQLVAKHTDKVFLLTTRQAFVRHGPRAAIWQRPKGVELQSLTNS
jgi:hypothetical protein